MRTALLVYPAVTAGASSLLFWTVEASSAARKKQDKQELFPLWRTQENSLLNSQKIIDGENAETGRYPWNALLRGDTICGGSLIARDLVVTAAHCGENVRRAEINLYDTTVDEPDARGRPIDSYHPHPNFNVEGPNYDIMIVKLRRPFENAIYEPIMLNFDSDIPTNTGDPLRMLGYGSTTTPEEGLQRATFLQEAPTQYMSFEDCSALFPADEAKPHWLCTLQTEPERYAFCFGDSGGPIFIKGNSPTEDILVGVISAGEGCANPVKPDVSQRISFHEDWIKTTGCELSEMPPDYWNCRSEDTEAPVPSTPTPDPTNPALPPILEPTNLSPTTPPATEPTMPPKKGPSPTSKSKLYSSSKSAKASKASSNIMSKSTQTFKTSKSIRGTTAATSSSKKEKKERSSEKKQSKLEDSEEIEEEDSEEIEEEENEEMGKSKKQKQKKKKSHASKKQTKLTMDSEDDSISMDSEDNNPISPDSEDVAPTNAPTTGDSKSKDSDEANTKTSKDTKNSNRRGRRYRRRLANSLSTSTATTMNFTRQKKASKRSSDIQKLELAKTHYEFARTVYQKDCASLEAAKQRVKEAQKSVENNKRVMNDAKKRLDKAERSLQVIHVDWSDEEGDNKAYRKKKRTDESSVLLRLPKIVKNMFGEVGYARLNSIWKPVLFLSPFSLDFKKHWWGVYEGWMEFYQKRVHGSNIFWDDMCQIVIELAGLPIPQLIEAECFMTYEQGHSQNLHTLPNSIKFKLQARVDLKPHEIETQRGVSAMEKARNMTQQERLGKCDWVLLSKTMKPLIALR